jgi:hypothetical protein
MTALGPFGQVRGIDLEIGAGQIIKQHVEIGVEQIAPAPDQMREQRFLMLQQQVVTGIKLVLFRKAEVRPQQIGHRAVAEPLAMQPPFAARRDQPVSRENLQNLVPARLLPARRLFALNRKKLRKTRRREGRYLLRTNLTDNDPAQLWQYYTQLVAVEEAFRNLKGRSFSSIGSGPIVSAGNLAPRPRDFRVRSLRERLGMTESIAQFRARHQDIAGDLAGAGGEFVAQPARCGGIAFQHPLKQAARHANHGRGLERSGARRSPHRHDQRKFADQGAGTRDRLGAGAVIDAEPAALDHKTGIGFVALLEEQIAATEIALFGANRQHAQ